MSDNTASPPQRTPDSTTSPTHHTLSLSPSTAQDISTFLPLIKRLYGSSSTRLVSCNNLLTSDILHLLSAAQKEESFVPILAGSVSRQLNKFGCGGRTVALWACLFFELLQSLRELQSSLCVNTVLEIAVEHCITRLDDISENIEKVSISDLCERLSHGVENYQLVAQCAERILSSPPSSITNYNSLSDSLSRHVTVLFEKSTLPSVLVSGHVIKTSSHMTDTYSDVLCGVKKVLMIAGDIAPCSGNLGYKGIVKEAEVRTAGGGGDQKLEFQDRSWEEKVRVLLNRLGVEVVLTSGLCKLDFINTGVCCVSGLSYEVLEDISENARVDLIPSVEFATPNDLVFLEFQECKEGMTVVKSPHCPSYTIILRRPVRNGSEKRYKTYLSRLQNVLKSGVVVPGAGQTERFCAEILSSFSLSAGDKIKFELGSHPDTDLIVTIISRRLSELFSKVATHGRASLGSDTYDYNNCNLSDLESNTFDFNNSLSDLTLDEEPQCGLQSDDRSNIYDDNSSKVAAWRLALETAKVLDSVSLSLKPISVVKR